MVSIIIPAKKHRVEFLLPEGERPGRLRDSAAKTAKGNILAFIDSDAYPSLKWIENAEKVFKEDSRIAIVCGPGISPPGESVSGKVYELLVPDRHKADKRKDIEDAPSCNLLIRKDVFEEVNGFDTDLWPGEDTILCEKVLKAGYRIVYDPGVVVYHHRRGFLGHLEQIARYGRMRGRFVKLYPKTSRKLKYFLPSLVALLLILTIIVYGISFIKGLIEKCVYCS